jgi:hypothetical protein
MVESKVGATDARVLTTVPRAPARRGDLLIAVAGAHLAGQPLNHQLTSRGGRLVKSCKSAPNYRLYALRTQPPKPGLVFDAAHRGTGIELEVWALDAASFGAFVDEVPAPLAIGTVTLDDESTVNGFVCEPRLPRLDAPQFEPLRVQWQAPLAVGSAWRSAHDSEGSWRRLLLRHRPRARAAFGRGRRGRRGSGAADDRAKSARRRETHGWLRVSSREPG